MVETLKAFNVLFYQDLEGAAAKAFKDVAAAMDDQKFAITSDASIFTEYEVKTDDAVVLFKKFDEGRNDLTETESLTSTEELTKFVAANALPLVVEFNHETGNFQFDFVNPFLRNFLILRSLSSITLTAD